MCIFSIKYSLKMEMKRNCFPMRQVKQSHIADKFSLTKNSSKMLQNMTKDQKISNEEKSWELFFFLQIG